MVKLKDAEILYLKGFNGKYINNQTGVSIQSLLKQLLAKGIKYDKEDIRNYQISYITSKYSDSDVKKAYQVIVDQYDNLDKAKRGKHIEILGCGFGEYPRVFREILGEEGFNSLRYGSWSDKQRATMLERYGVENPFDKEVFDDFVSDKSIAEGRIKRKETMLERYGVEHPLQSEELSIKMINTLRETNQKLYGVDYPSQRPEVARKIAESRQETMLKRYGAKNSVEVESIRNKIFKSRKRNGTLSSSLPEKELHSLLIDFFGDDDVIYNEVIDSRYPYFVDFYIPSRDLFIELNGDASHGDEWFDKSNPNHLAIVDKWTEGMYRIEAKGGSTSRYRGLIQTWTVSDVEKRNKAKEEDLNYLVFWDGSQRTINKERVPSLSDAREWLESGAPSPNNWNKKNSY